MHDGREKGPGSHREPLLLRFDAYFLECFRSITEWLLLKFKRGPFFFGGLSSIIGALMAMKVAIDARDSASQLAYFIFACAIALGYAIPGLVFDVYWRKGTLTPLPHQFSKDRIRTVLWVFIFILLLFITYILRWDDLFNFGRSFIVPLLSVLVTEYFFSAVPKNRKL